MVVTAQSAVFVCFFLTVAGAVLGGGH